MKARIINKSKEGVILELKYKFGAEKISFSWENFNKNFKISDKVWAEPREDYEKGLKEAQERVISLTKSFFKAKKENPNIKVDDVMDLEAEVKFVEEKIGCTTIEAVDMMRMSIDSTKENKKSKFNNNNRPRIISSTGSRKPTLGDHPEFEKLKGLIKE